MTEARQPRRGEFFDPVPESWEDAGGPFVAGTACIKLHRVGPREFKVPRRFGYRDPETGASFVIPRHPDTFRANLSSAPVLVNWIVPVLGSHFNAILLHDGLVEDKVYDPADPGQGAGYIGDKVTREEADRITRDAMGEQGTGFIRRWLAWCGMMIGTIRSPEGIVGSRRRHWWMLHGAALLYVMLGLASMIEIVGGEWGLLPWLDSDDWLTRLVVGGAAALLIPLVLSVFWGKRWRFAAILGVGFAVLLPAFVVTGLLTVGYILAERFFAWRGFARSSE